ncbi:hypothetical protein [Campylobacter gracilis]|uniref:Uncharacterized protein n=1 Tax=Campylobacter gracilis RM3268 TaxID=553220 RepID=C8PHH9_9BACT|nr:hypothetical protein [Campylobacter gracilis]AKT93313.1 hypothetical protein CGRAC_1899 [Campylobacter gracilis]EEV17593.1 hypothetical protein CAMGR0001_0424 [Campylobacter gracilis RM3268]UEB44529.1 hypothetical protein LK410_05730 [Campylobacter gracilis]SUW78362.1 molybdate transport repressor [Campylobacter gracilis]
MIVKENKKPVAMTLAGSTILALASGYCYHAGFGGAALFASVVAAFCAFFCALRLGAKNYLQIGEDAFTIVRGANSESFEYKDIANLGTKTFVAGRNKTELLNFVFKKAPQAQDRFNFLRFYSDTEATLPGSFEISIYELSKILREKAGLSQSPEEEQTAPKTRKGAKGSKKSASSGKNFKAKNLRDENSDTQNSYGAQNLGAENSYAVQNSIAQNSNGAADSNGAQNLKGASNLNEQSSAAPNGTASLNSACAGENFIGAENSASKISADDNKPDAAPESAAAASYDAVDTAMQNSACESKNK